MHPQHFGTDPTDIRICFLFCVCCFCSQRVYLLKQLRDQGLPLQKLHTVFQAIVLSRLMYALLTFLIHAYLTQTAQVPKLLDGAKVQKY